MKTTLKIKSRSNFVDFLTRFKTIQDNMALEIRPTEIICKSSTEDRAVLKSSKMPIADVFDGDLQDNIKVFIYSISRVVSVFKHFKPADEVAIDIKHENIGGEEIALSLVFKTKQTKIEIPCGDMNLFRYHPDEFFKKIVKRAVDSKKVEFPFPKDMYATISGLCTLDDKKDPITIHVRDGEIIFRGKSYEQAIGDAPQVPETDFVMFSEYFNTIEPETSTFMLCGDSMLVKSQESQTVVVLGRVQPNIS